MKNVQTKSLHCQKSKMHSSFECGFAEDRIEECFVVESQSENAYATSNTRIDVTTINNMHKCASKETAVHGSSCSQVCQITYPSMW